MTSSTGAPWGLPCPVCGWPSPGPGPTPCASCGLPAVGQAALVVARIGATLDELARDRDALVASLRAAALGAQPAPVPAAPAAAAGITEPPYAGPPPVFPTSPPVFPTPPHAFPPPPPDAFPPPPAQARPAPLRSRISPQQVLLGLGALLVVAAAMAFVAVAWTRLGVAFQAAVMLTVTAAACGVSAWTARRGLRATEEALAASGAALLAVDLAAAHALGLAGVDAVPLRLWTALSCGVVAGVALALGRLTRSTVTWPLVALLAAQPVPVLLLPAGAVAGPAGVAVALGVALLDLLAVLWLRPVLARVTTVLALLWAAAGAAGGVAVAWGGGDLDSWTATLLLVAGGAVTGLLRREPRLADRLPGPAVIGGAVVLTGPTLLAGAAAGVPAVALTGSLARYGLPGWVVAAGGGLVLLTAAMPLAGRPAARAGLLAAGGVLAGGGALFLYAGQHYGVLALVTLSAVVPAVLAAVLLPDLRRPAVGAALLLPVGAMLLAHEEGWLGTAAAGLLLALVGAAGFALAAVRAPAPEEREAAGAACVAGAAAGLTSAAGGAWGQVAIQLAVVGAAAGCYALVARRRWVAAAAVADLVVASWIALAGAAVETPEAYTLPAAAGLLLVVLPRLRSGARSWAAEGAAVGVALVPSALVVATEPSAVRLVLVVAGAAGLIVAGTFTHRQAPFVLGAASLAFVVIARLTPYAPLLPRWLTLATTGLLLLVLGATYERRRQQAREAVAWVAQMH